MSLPSLSVSPSEQLRIDDAMIRVNLVRRLRGGRRASVPGRTRTELYSLLIFLFAAAIMGYWYWSLNIALDRLQSEKDGLMQERGQITAIKAEMDRYEAEKRELQTRIEVMEQLMANQRGPVRMMNALVDSMPSEPKLWLTKLDQKDRSVVLQGFSVDVPTIADFIARLELQEAFRQVDLSYWQVDEQEFKFEVNCELN